MWPQTLQMSEDDCRSTLRRLELETYANVVGVFRAQGGLNDKKAKLLEELRNVFHISQDRHRAEARRVANDEHLSTIAKAVSGPNTWQEWSREGRRSYPMLPRIAPQTALGWIANNLASEVALQNAKLPYPVETAAAALEEQSSILASNAAAEASGFRYSDNYVVTSDPFKMPDIPAIGVKKNLKRGINDSLQTIGSSLNKKRNTNELSTPSKQKSPGANTAAGASVNTNSRKAISMNRLQQQRFFYQQQQKAKKLAKATGKREKPAGTNKSGRKSKKLKDQLNQQLLQEEELIQHDFSDKSYENQYIQQLGNFDEPQQQQHQQHIEGVVDQKESQSTSQNKSFYLPLMLPQIAASKRDITRNLTKLQIPGQVTTGSRLCGQFEAVPVPNQALNSPSISSQIIIGNKSGVEGKLAQLSTPVQKYIVEDRQPPLSSVHHSSNVTSPNICASTQQGLTSPFTSLSNPPTPNKLRTLNTSILPPGTKPSTSAKKLSGATILSATVLSPGSALNTQLPDNIINNSNTTAHLYSFVDGGGGGGGLGNTGTSSSNLPSGSQPTHTPPAVIQLHSNEVGRVSSQQSSAATSTQSKVLTTKILPIVLSGNASSPTFAKGDSSKNGNATIVSSANFVSNATGTTGSTIIKSLPSSLFVSGQNTSITSSSPIFTSFPPSGPIYRKHPNILKSSSSALSRNSLAGSGGPQIISNIRLTPAITTGNTTNSNLSMPQTQSGIFQQPLRSGAGSSTSGIRTSVKICQSPNGKVFIQPANVDTSKLTKLTSGQISQRILPGTLLGNTGNLNSTNTTASNSGNLSSNQPGSPQRIAIQKVQIIPAPLSANSLNNTAHTNQQIQQRIGTTSLTIGSGTAGSSKGGFSGNIFVPTGGALRSAKSSGPITLTKGAISGSQSNLLSSSNLNSLVAKQHSDMSSKASNVVVIDAASTTNKITPHHTKLSNLSTASNISRSNIDNNRMITEDTPVDIIVDSSPSISDESSPVAQTSSITAVLASNVLGDSQQSQQQLLTTQKQNSTMVPITVLNATDWEMELDQATAASINQNQQSGLNMSGVGAALSRQLNPKHQQQAHLQQTETAETIIIDDSFEDVIIEEEEQDDAIAENIQYDEQGQEDMDIEVSTDSEIIMVENLASIGERIQSEPKPEKRKKTFFVKEGAYRSLLAASEQKPKESVGILTDDDDAEDEPRLSVSKNHENVIAKTDVDHGLEADFVSDAQNSSEATVSEPEDIMYNNHEQSALTIQASRVKDHISLNRTLKDSTAATVNQQNTAENEFFGSADIKETPITEASKTVVSASLFSVTDLQDSAENIKKIDGEEESTGKFSVSSKETHCSSKNDSLHASDQ